MEIDLYKLVQKKKKRVVYISTGLFIMCICSVLLAVNLGRAEISFFDLLHILAFKITGMPAYIADIPESWVAIVWDIRFPRIIAAMIVGSGLAVSGAVFQSLLMNPLADSYTMGISSGAAFGASIAIYMNMFVLSFVFPITVAAFIGAFLTLILVMSIAKVKGHLSSANLIIAGIIVSSILSAGISFIKSASGENVASIVHWLMGSLSARTWDQVAVGLPLVLVSIVICMFFAEDLNIMCLGERESRSLGVDTHKVRQILLITGSVLTAVCVAVAGIIGFVGLIVPHILRMAIGTDNKYLIPLSALLGGQLLLAADTITRALLNVEIPVGILTTLLGGPFFIYIFMKKNKSLY